MWFAIVKVQKEKEKKRNAQQKSRDIKSTINLLIKLNNRNQSNMFNDEHEIIPVLFFPTVHSISSFIFVYLYAYMHAYTNKKHQSPV